MFLEDGGVDGLSTRGCVDSANWSLSSVMRWRELLLGDMMAHLEHADVVLGETSSQATIVNVLVEITTQNNIFPLAFPKNQLCNQLLIEQCSRRPQLALCIKVALVLLKHRSSLARLPIWLTWLIGDNKSSFLGLSAYQSPTQPSQVGIGAA